MHADIFTDPPGMPEDERMTPAEFKVIREWLGVSGEWLAQHLNVSARTVRHWEDGKYRIPDGVRLAIEALEAQTAEYVTAGIAALTGVTGPGILTYRSDEDYRAAHPNITFPASWHRRVAARIAQEVPALAIAYADDADASADASQPARGVRGR